MAAPEAAGWEAVLRASLAVSAETEEREILRTAVLAAHDHLGFDRCGLWLISQDRRELYSRFGFEDGLVEFDRATIPMPTHGLLLDLLEGRLPRIFVEDYQTLWADRLHPKMVGVDQWTAAPLVSPSGVFGYLSADNLYTRRPIAVGDQRRLAVFAQHVGNGIRLARELAEHRRTVDQLHERERLLTTVVNNAPLILFMLDAAGTVTFSDGAGLAVVGRQPGASVGHSVFELYAHQPVVLEGVRRALTGEVVRDVVRHGEEYVWEGRLTPVLDDDGQVTSVIGVSIDITEQTLAAEALREAKEAAEAADEAKGRFLALISHEVQTPLSGMLGMCDLTLASALSPSQRRWVEVIRSSADWLRSLIEEILTYSRGTRGQLVLEEREFSLGAVVEETLQALAATACRNGLELLLRIDPSLPDRRQGDPLRVRQILANLVGNALKFTAAGFVAVRVEPADGAQSERLRLMVEDTGPGIPAEQQQIIFEPFEQGPGDEPRRLGGSGLGLTVARQLAALMDGTIELHSRLGRGSTFTVDFRLPVAASAPDAASPVAGRRALVVMHHPDGAAIAAELLRQLGARADVATSVGQAEERVAAAVAAGDPPAVLVLEAELPETGGWLLTERLRGVLGEATPVIMLLPAGRQSHDPPADVIQVTKPIGPRALREALETALAAGRPPAETPPPEARRVLVAEDNPAGAELVATMLRRRGHTVELVSGGRALLARAAEAPPEVILLDLRLPDADGVEVARELRARGYAGSLVAMSAYPEGLTAPVTAAAGVDDYLAKPFRPAELFAVVERRRER